MDDINIKEEVYKCSKCGLCQSVCPLFLATKNEMYLARGRYNILNNFFNNNKPLSQKFINALDVCLNCNECKNFCPSSLDSAKIFTRLKNKYLKKSVPFSLKYKFILLKHSVKKYFSEAILYKTKVKRKKIYYQQKQADVVYFQGCFNKYINPSDKNAAMNLLNANGYNVIKVLNNCCGIKYISDGNLKAVERNAQKIIKSIPKQSKYLVTSCDSCYKTLNETLKTSQVKVIRLQDLIPETEKTENTFYHKPFSLEEYNGVLPLINKKGSCSLNENFLMLKYPDIAEKMLNTVFYTKEELEDKTIVTSCNLSKWGLTVGCQRKNANTHIMSEAEYIHDKNSII